MNTKHRVDTWLQIGDCKWPVHLSEHLTTSEKLLVPRSWKERLFSLPWRPLKATKTVYQKVPVQDVYIVDGMIVCHPDVFDILQMFQNETRMEELRRRKR